MPDSLPEAMVHFLAGPVLDWHDSRIACGARRGDRATWDVSLVSCPACKPFVPRQQAAERRPDPMPEKTLHEAVRQLATLHGWLYFCVYDSRHSPAGFPDYVLLRERDGATRCVVAELKSAQGKVTSAQAKWLKAWGGVGDVETYTWRPSDLQTIEAVLR